MKSKRCTDCNANRPLAEFSSNRHAKDGLSHYCKDCQRARRAQERLDRPRDVWARATYNGHRDRGHNILFSIAWLRKLAAAVDFCPWCGTRLHWERGRGQRHHDSPSLDRVTNEREMREDNVAIVCHRCNSAKGNSTLGEYLQWLSDCRASSNKATQADEEEEQ